MPPASKEPKTIKEKKTLKPIPEKVKQSVYSLKGPNVKPQQTSSLSSKSSSVYVTLAKRSASNMSSGSGQSMSSGSSALGSVQSTSKGPYVKLGPRQTSGKIIEQPGKKAKNLLIGTNANSNKQSSSSLNSNSAASALNTASKLTNRVTTPTS